MRRVRNPNVNREFRGDRRPEVDTLFRRHAAV
jgi:hypothetical protein